MCDIGFEDAYMDRPPRVVVWLHCSNYCLRFVTHLCFHGNQREVAVHWYQDPSHVLNTSMSLKYNVLSLCVCVCFKPSQFPHLIPSNCLVSYFPISKSSKFLIPTLWFLFISFLIITWNQLCLNFIMFYDKHILVRRKNKSTTVKQLYILFN